MDWVVLGSTSADGLCEQDNAVLYDCDLSSALALSTEGDLHDSIANVCLSPDGTFLLSPMESDESYLEGI
jgi:hypothetical protein